MGERGGTLHDRPSHVTEGAPDKALFIGGLPGFLNPFTQLSQKMTGDTMPPVSDPASNLHARTVSGFGAEWSRFDQTGVEEAELRRFFGLYFEQFPWGLLPPNAVGFDVGCGSGRWARFVAPRVGTLHCIDAAADALEVARGALAADGLTNAVFHHASVDQLPLPDGSMDFGYSLGVLHHVPDTAGGIASCVRKLKPGAPLLLYLYYAFDNRPPWYRWVWRGSEAIRGVVSRLPERARFLTADVVAGTVYFPLARLGKLAEKAGLPVSHFPLAFYRNASFYTMRTDSLDRFGTSLEQRFTQDQIRRMMEAAGLERISFRDGAPYWCAVGYKRGLR
jgi:ubiquinone/menaquinone biosynthesis C-methylase UbiE